MKRGESYKAEFGNGYVKFGCVQISKRLFKDILKSFNDHKKVLSKNITTVKIGRGIFYIETIKQIVEHPEF